MQWQREQELHRLPCCPEGRSSVCIHDFRRATITNWSRFANTQTVIQLAGHGRFETTVARYAVTTPDQIDLARRASAAALRQIGARTKKWQKDAQLALLPKSVRGAIETAADVKHCQETAYGRCCAVAIFARALPFFAARTIEDSSGRAILDPGTASATFPMVKCNL